MKEIKKKIKYMPKEENQTKEGKKKQTKIRPEKDPCNKKTKMQKSFPWSGCGSPLFRPKQDKLHLNGYSRVNIDQVVEPCIENETQGKQGHITRQGRQLTDMSKVAGHRGWGK